MFSENKFLIDKCFLKSGNTYFCKKDYTCKPLFSAWCRSYFYAGKMYDCGFDGCLVNEYGGFFIEGRDGNASEYFE